LARQTAENTTAIARSASEEGLSFGGGGEAVALVADIRGDQQRGGVSGTGRVPENLPELIGGPIEVNYGYQSSGPHVAPSSELARAFVAACRGGQRLPNTGGGAYSKSRATRRRHRTLLGRTDRGSMRNLLPSGGTGRHPRLDAIYAGSKRRRHLVRRAWRPSF